MVRRVLILGVALASALTGCEPQQRTTTESLGEAGLTQHIGPGELTPAEIGGELMGFADTYGVLLTYVSDRLYEAPMSPQDRSAAYWFVLHSLFGTYTIASDPNPVVALLDMIVLVTLTRMAAEDHWANVLSAESEALRAMCRKGEDEIWSIAAEVMIPEEQDAMRELIGEWRAENPDLRFVSFVRFEDFSEHRRQLHATAAGPKSIFGLLGLDPLANVDPATREIERSRMLAERTFFFMKRLPLLMSATATGFYLDVAASDEAVRLQDNFQALTETTRRMPEEIATRVAVEREAAIEQLSEAVATERQAVVSTLEAQEPRLRGMLEEIRQTVEAGNELAKTIQAIVPPPGSEERVQIEELQAVVEQTTLAADGLTQLVQSVDQVLEPEGLEARLDRLDAALALAEARGRSLIDRAFVLAAALVGLIFVASMLKLLLQQGIIRRSPSS